MKIGILTLFHENYNWGGVLQGYALKTYLETSFENVQADLLIYHGKNIVYESKIKQITQYSLREIVGKVMRMIRTKDDSSLQKMLSGRNGLFKKFTKEYSTNTRVYDDKTLIDAAKEYDCLISGSDQVWNPNVAKAGFFQQMIQNECMKVAYAASIARDDLSKHERDIMIPLIERFDAVSVREKTAKKILEKYSDNGLLVTEVLDPTLMLSKETWMDFAQKSPHQFDGKYAVAFFFSESLRYREAIARYCETKQLGLKFIPFARGEYIASDEKGDAERLFDLGPYDFVKMIQNAECVFTDSFHGAVFSIIFHKKVCVFERDKKGKVSKNSRLFDLLDKFNMSEYLIHDVSDIDRVMSQTVDFDAVDDLHKQYKKDSEDFLAEVISKCSDEACDIDFHRGTGSKQACDGCGLCAIVCPQKCIKMCMDNEGFFYPYVEESECIKCGLCVRICEEKHTNRNRTVTDPYIGFHKDEKIREDSSSGGLFYALASLLLQRGGTVYGAAYAEDFSVRHIRVTHTEELHQLLTSKYVQSSMQNVFEQVLEDLKKKRIVLFSGTPCQVAAMHRFIPPDLQSNLVLIDFICHGVPSPGVWLSYVRYLEECAGSAIKQVNFRDKEKGWHDYHLKIRFEDSVITESHETNAYMRTFLSDKNIRRSCYECFYKNESYFSDITLGDAWKVEKDYPDWADDKGTSFFIIRSTKGEALLSQIKGSFEYRPTDYEAWKQYNPSLVYATRMPKERQDFFAKYQATQHMLFWKTEKRLPHKKAIRYIAKKVAMRLGVGKFLRRIWHS